MTHDQIFIVTGVGGDECCLLFVALSDAYYIISTSQAKFSKYLSSYYLTDGRRNQSGEGAPW